MKHFIDKISKKLKNPFQNNKKKLKKRKKRKKLKN